MDLTVYLFLEKKRKKLIDPKLLYWLLYSKTCPNPKCCWKTNEGFFFVINNFLFSFFYKQHNIISKIKQNKTKQQTHTQHLKVQSKGRERGKDNKNTKVTHLNNHVHSVKNTAKPQWLKAWPHRLAPLYTHMRQLQEATDPICLSTHVWCKPVLNYCLLHSCKTSKQHSLLHRTNTEIRIIIKKTQTWVNRPINSQ